MKRIILALLALLIAAPAIAQEAAPTPQTVLGPKTVKAPALDTVTGPAKYRYPKKYDGYVLKDYTVSGPSFSVRNNDGSNVTVDGGTSIHTGSPEKISANFAVGGSGTLTLRNVHAIGSYDPLKKVKTEFANVDNVMGAQRTHLNIIGGTFEKAWESAIDTKAETKLFGTITCIGGARCLKAWSNVVGQPGSVLVSINSRQGDVSCLKSPVVSGNVHLPFLKVVNDDPNGLLTGFNAACSIRIDACELHVPPTYRVTWAKGGVKGQTLILGPTCAKGGKVVVAPMEAEVPGAQILDAGQLLPDGSRDGLITLRTVWAKKLHVKVNTVVRHIEGFRYQVVR